MASSNGGRCLPEERDASLDQDDNSAASTVSRRHARTAPHVASTQHAPTTNARPTLWAIDVNPAKLGVDHPSPRRREQRPFESWAELDAVGVESLTRDLRMVIFAAATGLRPTEWLALERRDIDLEARVVYVHRSSTKDRSKCRRPRRAAERCRRRQSRSSTSTFDLSRCMGAGLTMMDRHYGHLARDERDHANLLLDQLCAEHRPQWTLVETDEWRCRTRTARRSRRAGGRPMRRRRVRSTLTIAADRRSKTAL
jgi:integrase